MALSTHTPSLAVIMAGHHDDGKDGYDDGKDGGLSFAEYKEQCDNCAEELFDALKSGDKAKFADALDTLLDLHENAPPPDEPSKGDMGGDEEEDGDELRL